WLDHTHADVNVHITARLRWIPIAAALLIVPALAASAAAEPHPHHPRHARHVRHIQPHASSGIVIVQAPARGGVVIERSPRRVIVERSTAQRVHPHSSVRVLRGGHRLGGWPRREHDRPSDYRDHRLDAPVERRVDILDRWQVDAMGFGSQLPHVDEFDFARPALRHDHRFDPHGYGFRCDAGERWYHWRVTRPGGLGAWRHHRPYDRSYERNYDFHLRPRHTHHHHDLLRHRDGLWIDLGVGVHVIE
ncbi:MAG: hypothetical protein WD009_12865, partial [Phycisphaeraceae bacterium]